MGLPESDKPTLQLESNNESFLLNIWEGGGELPRLSGSNLVLYYFEQGLRTVTALPMSNVVTVITIAISLFFFSGFLLLLQNVDDILSNAGSRLSISAYLQENADGGQIQKLAEHLEGIEGVRGIRTISKQQALENFRKSLGARSHLLEGLGTHNPLPASLEVDFEQNGDGFHALENVVASLKENPAIAEVIYGEDWVQRVRGVLKVFRVSGVIALTVVLLFIVLLISNTIKLVMYSRRDEIAIMKLVGATNHFIQIPFVIGGTLQGFCGAILGLVLLSFAAAALSHQIQGIVVLGLNLPQLVFLSAPIVIGILMLGMLVGATGSFLAVRKFVDV